MSEKIIVLGLGNLLCGDDGFGVRVIQSLQASYRFPECCEIIDGGTQGQILYGLLEEADRLLLVDAVDLGSEPASLRLYSQEEIPVWLGTRKLSAHQNSFAEVLALGAIKEILPEEINLLGFQCQQTEFGAPLSESAEASLRPAEQIVLAWLAERAVLPKPQ